MSMDKSLKRRGALVRARNVLTRHERIAKLIDQDRWGEGRSPFGLPKVRVYRVVAKKAKKKAEEAAPTEGAAAAAAPAAAPAADKPKAGK
jgi:small basic protein (TIGR04137 family)